MIKKAFYLSAQCKLIILIIITAAVLVLNLASVRQTYAESDNYARVLSDKVAFYADSQGKYFKFYLPYSYYVRVTEVGDEYSKVKYMENDSDAPEKTGYVLTSELSFTDETPTNPFPSCVLTVNEDDVLYSGSNIASAKSGIEPGYRFRYYGKITYKDEEYYYVYGDGNFGYVKTACFAYHEIPVHPNPVKTIDSSLTSDRGETLSADEKNPSGVQSGDAVNIIIIVAVAVVGITAVYVLFRPQLGKVGAAASKNDDYDRE